MSGQRAFGLLGRWAMSLSAPRSLSSSAPHSPMPPAPRLQRHLQASHPLTPSPPHPLTIPAPQSDLPLSAHLLAAQFTSSSPPQSPFPSQNRHVRLHGGSAPQLFSSSDHKPIGSPASEPFSLSAPRLPIASHALALGGASRIRFRRAFELGNSGQVRWITHYQRLGIQPPSDAKEIKLAYFKRAKECHPDIHGDGKTLEFQELSKAYSILSDPRQKAAYDAAGYRDPATSGSSTYGGARSQPGYAQAQTPSDFDLDDAFRIFQQVWAEYGAKEYMDTLRCDLQRTKEQASLTKSWRPWMELAERRKILIATIVLPSLAIFRFPWIAVGMARLGMLFSGFLLNALLLVLRSNPQLSGALLMWMWRQAVKFYQLASRDQGNRKP